jgi:nucleotide-binding universal stress UspA family protein
MFSRLIGDERVRDASSDGDVEASSERVLCLFDVGEPTDGRFVQVAAAMADGGRFVVPVDGAATAQSLKPESTRAPVEYETRFLERPPAITTEWVADVVKRFDISVIFDLRDRQSVLGGGELALTTGCTHVTVTTGTDVESLSSCLVPVAEGPHLDETLDVARTIGESHDAWLDLFHVEDDDPQAETDALFDYCADHLGDFDAFDTWQYEGWSPAQAIVEQSSYYDATVIAAPRKGRVREFVDGSTTEVVQSLCENSVVTVRSGNADCSRFDRWLGEFLAPKR